MILSEPAHEDFPEISSYFQTGGLVDAVVNLGLPAPIDIQVSGKNLQEACGHREIDLRRRFEG